MPPVADSPGQPSATSADAPAAGPTPDPAAPVAASGARQRASATSASQAPREKAAIAPASREDPDAANVGWQGPPRPLASTVRSRSAVGGTSSRAQVSRGSLRPSTQAPADPAPRGSTAKVQGSSGLAHLGERPALPAEQIRVFIHHAADQPGNAALAERLAEHLRHQGFTVADIRPVDVRIEQPSVRYFFEDDRGASERLVDALGRFLEHRASGAPRHASDFTHFVPKPRQGNVEVWLPAREAMNDRR